MGSGHLRSRTAAAGVAAGAVLLIAALLTSTGAAFGQSDDGGAAPSDVGSIVAWSDIALGAVVATAGQSPPHSLVTMALVQAAVYDAVVAILGGYEPYIAGLEPAPDASVEAAVAAAAHGVLAHYLPDQQADLDGAYESALAAIEDGAAKDSGVGVGQAAAAALIAAREGDGYAAASDFTMPEPAPGAWQLPAEQNALAPWIADLRPFLLESPDQFRPAAPPDLTSPEWAANLNEVRDVGGAESATRTPEQALIAQFWSTHPTPQAHKGIQGVALDNGLDAVETARLMALASLVAADTIVACWDAKYEYLFWRPFTAVPGAVDDGNDATEADAAWVPLIGTPPHPEYPSAHSCVTPSLGLVIADALGTDQIGLTLDSVPTAETMPTRTFATVEELAEEVMNARIWGGIHYRVSTDVGRELGRQVTEYALANYLQPTS